MGKWLSASRSNGIHGGVSCHSSIGLREGVTDNGLAALADAGCGEKLTLLHLDCERVLVVSILNC